VSNFLELEVVSGFVGWNEELGFLAVESVV
jgi:hypothetical protein